MSETAAILAAVILAALAAFQLALAAGWPLGRYAWGGQHRVLPLRLRVGSAISIGIYIAIAVILLERSGVVSLFNTGNQIRVLAWVIVAFFLLGIAMNAASRSRPERYLMTPLVTLLTVLAVIVATG